MWILAVCLFFSCGSLSPEREIFLRVPPKQAGSSGTEGEIRSLVETGAPPPLIQALERIRETGPGTAESGRVMKAVASALLTRLYGEMAVPLPQADPPGTHSYERILRDAERGIYTPVPAASSDYLEHVLPFLALLGEEREDRFAEALGDLRRAMELRETGPGRDSVLAPYFLGLALERTGDDEGAWAAYSEAYAVSEACYPAALGLARLLEKQGRLEEEAALISDSLLRYPEIPSLKRRLAFTLYRQEDWAGAETLIAELLKKDGRDGELLLMRARALLEQKRFIPAQGPLDLYGAIDPQNRQYLFLQARLQAEGYRNIDAALSFLRTIILASEGDDKALLYAARLLLESEQEEDRDEGREILGRLLQAEHPPVEAERLALKEAIRREAWREARPYLDRVLQESRGAEELFSAFTVERGLGNRPAALAAARELYRLNPAGAEGVEAYVTALIEGDRPEEAGRLIEEGLSGLPGGARKSRYYYLRSRLRANEEQAISDLRNSLFEDPRNLRTLIALFEVYRNHKNDQRAVFYLKQALALAPDAPELRRYREEYSAWLE